MSARLLDEFRVLAQTKGLASNGEFVVVGVMADLLWDKCGSKVVRRLFEVDPAFVIEGFSRLVVLARINEEIRYYAARLEEGGDWGRGGEVTDARRDAVRNERWAWEIGVFSSLENAVVFTDQYLNGAPLEQITVPRVRKWHRTGER